MPQDGAWADLMDDATAARVKGALAGLDLARHLDIGELVPGDVGVISATVHAVQPTRAYNRKRGGEGVVCRVTLADATGETELVLWDHETRRASDGTFEPGNAVVLRGATVKAGFRGGIELALGQAEVDARPPATVDVAGELVGVGPTQTRGVAGAPSFCADLDLRTAQGHATVSVSGPALLQARLLQPGVGVLVRAVRVNPAFSDRYFCTALTAITTPPAGVDTPK